MHLHRRTRRIAPVFVTRTILASSLTALTLGCGGGNEPGGGELSQEEGFAHPQRQDAGTDSAESRADAGGTGPTGQKGGSGGSADAPLWIPDADEEMPQSFSSFGLYPDAPDLSTSPTGAHAYEPRFPLWSNGSEKYRIVAFPTSWDSAESVPDPDPDAMPEGITFFKTFTFDDDSATGHRPAETRVIRLGVDGWEYHRYTWNDEGSDATLNTSRVQEYTQVEFDGRVFEHEIPNETDCKRCHEAAAFPILGYTELQLMDAPMDAAPDEMTERVMGYVVGNCNHCHNGGNSDANSFDMAPDVFLEAVVDRMTEGSGSGIGVRVVPGDPESSVLWIALGGGDEATEIQPMPPLGVQIRDRQAVELFREWIDGLQRIQRPSTEGRNERVDDDAIPWKRGGEGNDTGIGNDAGGGAARAQFV